MAEMLNQKSEELKYTAEDLHIAFFAGGILRESLAGTKDEAWKEAMRRGMNGVKEDNRVANRTMTTPDFERQFNQAKQSVLGDSKPK